VGASWRLLAWPSPPEETAIAPLPQPVPPAVVIPVHNRADLLEAALASVAAQTLPPAEVIVVDDGSTDGSAAVAERFGATVLRQPPGGVSAARNRGLAASSAPYVAFLDSDDEWEPGHLAALAAKAGGHSIVSTAALSTDGALIGSQSRVPLALTAADRLLWPDNPVVTSAVLVDRALALEVGGFDEQLRHSEDLDLWAKLLERGPGLVLPDVTVRYRTHAGQTSLDVEAMRSGTGRVLGRVSEATRRSVAIRDRWDGLRASGSRSLVRLAWFAAPTRVLVMMRLLTHRARGRRIAAQAGSSRSS
jgi:glycosyltransferase involved in cell wall biosynthesis